MEPARALSHFLSRNAFFVVMILAIMGLFLVVQPAGAAVETGKPAPDFTGASADGSAVKLADTKGKIVVLEWTNPGCPFVKKHYSVGHMQALQKEATDKGVVWLAINSSAAGKEGALTPEDAKKLVQEQKIAATDYLLDPTGEIGKLYGAKTTPHLFVIAADGTLAYQGAIDDKPTPSTDDIAGAKNYAKAAYEALLAGKTPDPATTQPYGCSVKY